MPELVRVVNIEEGMPRVDEARDRLMKEIQKAKVNKVSALKIIHGYGSTGQGGALKIAINKSLSRMVKEGKLRAVVPGDNWSIFDNDSRVILEHCPNLNKDHDLEKGNPGITVVLL